MVKKIPKKGFIEERGFKKFISPFKEVIEMRGWKIICEHIPPELVALVREFYANMVGRKETTCYVRGKWVSFHIDKIIQLLKLGKLSTRSKYKKLKKNLDYQKILKVLSVGKREMEGKQEDFL